MSKCIEPKCYNVARCNYIDKIDKLYCVKHIKEDMIDLDKKRCIEGVCKEKTLL